MCWEHGTHQWFSALKGGGFGGIFLAAILGVLQLALSGSPGEQIIINYFQQISFLQMCSAHLILAAGVNFIVTDDRIWMYGPGIRKYSKKSNPGPSSFATHQWAFCASTIVPASTEP